MFNKKIYTITLIIVALILLSGCSISLPGMSTKEYKMGEIDFNIVDTNSKEFAQKKNTSFQKWYEANYKNGGVYSYSEDGIRYILIGAGERLTGGYRLEDIAVIGKEKEIEIKARLYGPKEGEIATQGTTYPHSLITIEDDGRELACSGVVLVDSSRKVEHKKMSGKFVEITKDGLLKLIIIGSDNKSEEKEYTMDDKLKESINKTELKKDIEIIFTYYLDEKENPIVIEVNKM